MASISTEESQPSHDANHPPLSYNFPKRPFGKKNVVYRSCRAEWFRSWSSLVPQTLIIGNTVWYIAYIELFQRNSIIIVYYVTGNSHCVVTSLRVNFSLDYEILIINISLVKPVSTDFY